MPSFSEELKAQPVCSGNLGLYLFCRYPHHTPIILPLKMSIADTYKIAVNLYQNERNRISEYSIFNCLALGF